MNERYLKGRGGRMETRGGVALMLLLLFAAVIQGLPW